MSSAAQMLRASQAKLLAAGPHGGGRPPRPRRELRTIDLEPLFPWKLHYFNPTPCPDAPIHSMTKDQMGATPVAHSTQCRTCWGWVDDPRHLTPTPNRDLEPVTWYPRRRR